VRLCWNGVPAINVPTPVKYLSAAEGGVSQFRYFRDNTLLTWMHARLLCGFFIRLPLLLWLTAEGRQPAKKRHPHGAVTFNWRKRGVAIRVRHAVFDGDEGVIGVVHGGADGGNSKTRGARPHGRPGGEIAGAFDGVGEGGKFPHLEGDGGFFICPIGDGVQSRFRRVISRGGAAHEGVFEEVFAAVEVRVVGGSVLTTSESFGGGPVGKRCCSP
jgi:hypothetical protein